jgi:large subunit ribosomal protein L21
MYSIVAIGGSQYKVRAGDLIDVAKLDAEVGSTLEFDKVLTVEGEAPTLGTPYVEGASVSAKVLRHDKDKKILVLKRQPGKWQKKKGHRQHFTSLLITKLQDGQGKSAEIEKDSKLAKRFLESK